MRVIIELESRNRIKLPHSINSVLQSFLYAVVKGDSEFDKMHKSISYKNFTFSTIRERFRKIDGGRLYGNCISFVFSTNHQSFINTLLNSIMFSSNLDLAGNPVNFKSVSPIQNKIISTTEKIKTLSPITVYDDIVNSEGKKFRSYCLDVYSERFTRLLRNNLIRKASKLYDWDLSNAEFAIECLSNPRIVSATYKHKNNVIKGIDAIFKLSGDVKLIQIAYEVGLGSKNAQGWGCIEFKGDK